MTSFSITSRFERRVCPAQYEHVEAEASITLNVEEGTTADAKALSVEAMTIVRESAIAGLKGKPVTVETRVETKTADGTVKTETVTPTATAPVKGKPGRPPKDKPVDPAPVTPPPAAEVDEFGETVALVAEVAAEEDEFASTATTAEPEKQMTANELQTWITGHINAKKLEVPKVKEVLKKYGAARTADTKDEDRSKIKAEIEKLLK